MYVAKLSITIPFPVVRVKNANRGMFFCVHLFTVGFDSLVNCPRDGNLTVYR